MADVTYEWQLYVPATQTFINIPSNRIQPVLRTISTEFAEPYTPKSFHLITTTSSGRCILVMTLKKGSGYMLDLSSIHSINDLLARVPAAIIAPSLPDSTSSTEQRGHGVLQWYPLPQLSRWHCGYYGDISFVTIPSSCIPPSMASSISLSLQ
jgi:hypothetical protein